MMRIQKRNYLGHIPALAIAIVSLGLISGCGNSQPYADHLSVSVNPNTQVLMGPGPDSSCVDETNYKIALAAATAGAAPPILGTSVTGPVILFNNFTLTWNSADTLFVQGIRIIVSGAGIAGSPFEYQLPQTEIEDLLANAAAVINPQAIPGEAATTPPVLPIVISSADILARQSTAFAPCGLAVGGIPLTNGTKTTSFGAAVQIIVIGTAQDSNGNQRFVEVSVNTTARYFGS